MRIALLSLATLTGCTAPQMSELRALDPDQTVVVPAGLDCVFGKGLDYASGMHGFFTWHAAPDQRSAWFRAPFTLITLSADGPNKTEVKRQQTRGGGIAWESQQLMSILTTSRCT